MTYHVADLFEHAVDLMPDRVAIACGDRQVTYAELEARTNRLAHHLAEHGVGVGSHVGQYSRNRLEAIETMIAAYKLRATPINVNYRYVREELRYLFDNADLVALVHERQYSDVVREVLPDVPSLKHVLVVEDGSDSDAGDAASYEAALAEAGEQRDFGERSADDVYVLYTGGTTGMPKGVMWRHEDIWRVLGGGIDFYTREPLADEWRQASIGAAGDGQATWFTIPPLIHGAAKWPAMQALFGGGKVVLTPKFDGHEVWRLIERHRVNIGVITGDAMARPMLDALAEGRYDTSSLGVLASGAALFSPSVKDQFRAALPNVLLSDSVGASETGFNGMAIAGSESEQSEQSEQEGGPRVQPGAGTVVLGDDDRLAEPGVVGRLARSGHIPLGYYKDPAKTAEMYAEVDGVRYAVPGDSARLEHDGTITLLGRGNLCINTGGEKVFPEEVEAALKAHGDVFDALVVGVPDERFGHTVAAVIEPRPHRKLSFVELDRHVREHVAGYKVPRRMWVTDKIERSPSGKPDYRWARRYLAEREAEHDAERETEREAGQPS